MNYKEKIVIFKNSKTFMKKSILKNNKRSKLK